ncbi:hypothetical protein TRFO_26784 [Tritrichomonas foetus]|uniref:Myb-like DNA-binding domain containing protein n=1 Tax=Tritrichomonas foetus TaxID=1144522 RepID=A0A1J4K732_9EUKA|nr:hypothetical protein TRFO_26784 [Tritrichomonas foetus]|eukprot:OHT05508.1 hypothetical protein TRFO_26784 [Tritrichomonas foetus]
MNKSSWTINLDGGSEIAGDHLNKVCACRRRVFTTEEDKFLAELVSSQKCTNWHEVAQKLPGRTARQCRDRWTNYLSPSNSFAPWTKEEDLLVIEKVNEFGTRWSVIAKYIEGRSDNTIKNRWYSGLKKSCYVDSQGKYVMKGEKGSTSNSAAKGGNKKFKAAQHGNNSGNKGEGKFTTRVKASPQSKIPKSASQSQQETQIQSPQSIPVQLQQAQTQPAQQQQQTQLETQQDELPKINFKAPFFNEMMPQHLQTDSRQQSDRQLCEPFLSVPTNMPHLFNQTSAFQYPIQSLFQSSSQNMLVQQISYHQPEESLSLKELDLDSLENDFWDCQLFNQVAEMNQDPFQIPELYGEWF